MSHKTQLIERMRAARAELDGVIAALDGRLDADLGNDWQARDVLAHLALWERVAARKLGGGPVPLANELLEMDPWDLDRFNVTMRERWRARPTAEILAESRAAHEALLVAVGAADDAECAPGDSVHETIEVDGAGHYGVHLPELRAAAG